MKQAKNWLEWLVFGVSSALVLVVVAALAWEIATQGNRPPEIELSLGPARQHGETVMVPIIAHNTGDNTAEDVLIEITSGEERAELRFQYVPRRSKRHGWVVFSHAGEAHARVLGFREP